MWWIIGLLLVICIFVFIWLFTRGADMKNKSNYVKQIEDADQEKAVRRMKA